MEAELASTRIGALFSPIVDLIELAGALVVIFLGTLALTEGSLTIGGLLVFLAYLTQLYSPIRELSSLTNTIFAASAGAERVIELLEERPGVEERPDAVRIGRARGRVELRDVSFRYPDAERDAVQGVSLTVEPGRTLALVGASGAGKSTLARLLLRFADPSSGRLTLDGHDLRDLRLDSLRDNLAMLLQETLIFDGTAYENIAYGRDDATREEVVAAARAARACRAASASGSRSRALVRDAPVLIIDEPSTGLDSQARQRRPGGRARHPRRAARARRPLRGPSRRRVRHRPDRAGRGAVSRRAGLRAGSRIGAYRVIVRLARGRTLDVFDAWSDERDCRVVVKTPRPAYREDAAAVRRLLAEGRLLERLSHPHIVRGYETLRRPLPMVVMETLSGRTVAHLIDGSARRLGIAEVAMLGVHLCSAVGYLHRQGYVHLDLKPSNVVAEGGRAKLIDLGHARRPGRLRAGVGTWCYMAPEQARGGLVDAPADVWGIGAVLHEAATAHATFDEESADGYELPYPQLVRHAAPIRALRRVPAQLARAIDACLDPDPAARPKLGALAAVLGRAAGSPPLGQLRGGEDPLR